MFQVSLGCRLDQSTVKMGRCRRALCWHPSSRVLLVSPDGFKPPSASHQQQETMHFEVRGDASARSARVAGDSSARHGGESRSLSVTHHCRTRFGIGLWAPCVQVITIEVEPEHAVVAQRSSQQILPSAWSECPGLPRIGLPRRCESQGQTP